VSRQRKRLARLLLTQRAISDLLEIETYTVETWGAKQAAKYLSDIESGMRLIRENPGVLQSGAGLPDELRYHHVNKHLLICDVQSASIVVLTVIHASMDVPARLAELVPQLADEVAALHQRLASRDRK
jgi:toxin ParE1/3/4